MTCREARRELVIEVARTYPEAAPGALAHARACEDCRKWRQEIERLGELVRSLPPVSPAPHVIQRLEARLAGASLLCEALAKQSLEPRAKATLLAPSLPKAAAAAVLVVALTTLFLWISRLPGPAVTVADISPTPTQEAQLWLRDESGNPAEPVTVGSVLPRDRSFSLAPGARVRLDLGTTGSLLLSHEAIGYFSANSAFHLVHGQILARLHSHPGGFRVKTRFGSVTATGTTFLVRLEKFLGTVTVLEGNVLVEKDAERVALGPSQQSILRAGRPPSPPVLLTGVEGPPPLAAEPLPSRLPLADAEIRVLVPESSISSGTPIPVRIELAPTAGEIWLDRYRPDLPNYLVRLEGPETSPYCVRLSALRPKEISIPATSGDLVQVSRAFPYVLEGTLREEISREGTYWVSVLLATHAPRTREDQWIGFAESSPARIEVVKPVGEHGK